MLSRKIFLRLCLFVVLYIAYLGAFNYLSIQEDGSKEQGELGSKKRKVTPSYEDKICSHNDQVDAIMQEYLPLQNKHLDTIKTTGKFIVFSAIDSAGLGNRIPTLVSCFILSLLTDRGFLVHWPSINESFNSQKEHIGMAAFENLFNTPFFMDSTLHPEFYDAVSPNTTKIISVEDLSNVLLCGDFEEEYKDTRIIIIYGWRPFLDILLRNKNYLERVDELNLTSLVHDISQCLLRPIPLVNEIIDRYKQQSNIGPQTKIIGVHIRKQSLHGLSNEQELALWECVRAKYPPPRINYVAGWSNLNASILYFLASDSPEALINAPPDFRPQTDSSRHTTEGLAHAVADMWLLGQSQEMFGAQGTTFLAAVRTLFAVRTQLVAWTASQNSQSTLQTTSETSSLSPSPAAFIARCVDVNALPCYKWWDVFREVSNFSLSCFIANSGTSAKDSFVC